jgi:ubiquinol-cytochrome c reductase cytochrome c1 subunit
MRKIAAVLGLSLGLLATGASQASEGGGTIHEVDWPHEGLFGTYDRAAVQRGLQVYQNVCQACHSVKYLAFRNLEAVGYNEDEIRAIAAQYTVMDGPDDTGEMFERPARASDRLPGPYANPAAARAANGGALPPDLSLIVKARAGGANYIYSVLTGYVDPPPDVEVPEGLNYNSAFPGHFIAMPPILQPDAVSYSDGTSATVEQMASDVTQFLAWLAEPKLEDRKRTGLKVMLFLLVLTGLFLALKRRVWAELH